MQMNPYLSFDGKCADAFAFYAKALGAKVEVTMPYAGSPMADHVPAGWGSKIMHGRITIGDQLLMASDAMPDCYQKPQGFSVTLNIADSAEAERTFHALADGGTVGMPIQETFWASRFGTVTDRFGIPWMINCEKPMG